MIKNSKPAGPAPNGRVVAVNPNDVLKPKGDPQAEISGSQVPAFSSTLLNSVVSAAWFFQQDSNEDRSKRVTAAFAAMRAFAPKDEVEGMMAAQAVAMHMAAMECARRAMLPDQPGEAASRLRRDAANLSRAMVDMAEAINVRRGKGPQIVRVERVVVNDGGQAIVGHITSGAPRAERGGGTENGMQGEPHAPRAIEEQQPAGRSELGATLRRPDAERARVPRAGDG